MHLVSGTDLESGQFFNGTRPARASDQAYDQEARRRLGELSTRLLDGG